MKCTRCELEIEGEISRCHESCMCGGKEGRITHGGVVIARIYGYGNDEALHVTENTCIQALKHRVMALEAHT
jgi:hypothetical protein